jgi:hypothetical protein
VRAGFAPLPQLIVQASGTGGGRVTSSPAGISCAVVGGVAQPVGVGSTCRAAFAQGSSVTLTAVPDPGHAFLEWTGVSCAGTAGSGGSTCTVPVREATAVGVTFVRLPAVA